MSPFNPHPLPSPYSSRRSLPWAISSLALLATFAVQADMVVSASSSGSSEQQTLTVSLSPNTEDAGKSANLYLAAVAGNQLFAASGTVSNHAWQVVQDTDKLPDIGTVTFSANGAMGAGVSIPAFSGIDTRGMAGTTVYAGYGANSQDMLKGKFALAYTLPAASHANLAYAASSPAQVLDLYLPAGSGPFPLVINIHGGAFLGGDKAMLDSAVLARLLAAGYAVATINYRLSGEAVFPAAIQDAKAAVRFLRANANQYHLDPKRFASFGQSAGGNIAAMLGTTGGSKTSRNGTVIWDDAKLGNPDVSSVVQAVVDWFGPTDFAQMDSALSAQGCAASFISHNTAASPESRFLGIAIGSSGSTALVQDANPISYVSAATPPFLIEHGSVDCNVPAAQSQLLAAALSAQGIDNTIQIHQGAGHGMPAESWSGKTSLDRLLAFLDRVLKR
ncbi:alpha/beta hydrolase fold domain-containing protein [Chitinimonas sp.]|uniref:alpha/beta hydrolase fold domain-containing protein n=1 Tax=Chitinimonas sp. TaxID=1934313 RepID=UPI0035B3867C